MGSVRTITALIGALLALVLPAAAGASSSGSFSDPIGDTPEFAPDLGATTVTVGDDETIVVDTRIVPRPPAYWGGCPAGTGAPSGEVCAAPEISLTWYFDYSIASGVVADNGPDAKVVAMPFGDRTLWQSERWNATNGTFLPGAEPVAAGDSSGTTWMLSLADLGVPRSTTLRIWVVSRYGSDAAENHSDTAGPGTVSVLGQGGEGPGIDRSCTRAIGNAVQLQRRIQKVKLRKASAKRRRLSRLRGKHRRALRAMARRCDAPG